jgi:hypothetical protein
MVNGFIATLADCAIHAILDDGTAIPVPGVHGVEFGVEAGEAAGLTIWLRDAETELELDKEAVAVRLMSDKG